MEAAYQPEVHSEAAVAAEYTLEAEHEYCHAPRTMLIVWTSCEDPQPIAVGVSDGGVASAAVGAVLLWEGMPPPPELVVLQYQKTLMVGELRTIVVVWYRMIQTKKR
jgi:hypothetical protein